MADGDDNVPNSLELSGMRAGDHGSGATVRWWRGRSGSCRIEEIEWGKLGFSLGFSRGWLKGEEVWRGGAR
jgi:hypothetical protein